MSSQYDKAEERQALVLNNQGVWEQNGDIIGGDKYVTNNYYFSHAEQEKSPTQHVSGISGLLLEDLKKDVEKHSRTPVMNVFRDRITWGILFKENLYVSQKFIAKKADISTTINDADDLFMKYSRSNLLVCGDAGYGKTASLEYLYQKYALKEGYPVYHLPAYVFIRKKNSISHFEKSIREAIENRERIEGLLLIDGLEEAFLDNYTEASSWIQRIWDTGTHFWIACRSDFRDNLASEDMGFFDSTAFVEPWDSKDFYGFVIKYGYYLNNPELYERTKNLVDNYGLTTEFTSIYRPLYALLFMFLATEYKKGEEELIINNEYDLIERFVDVWFDREGARDGRQYSMDDYLPELRRLAIGVYENNRPVLADNVNVIRELVVIEKKRSKLFVEKFCHREFCNYFVAESIINGMRSGNMGIIDSFSHIYYDDVTSLYRAGIKLCPQTEVRRMYSNMFLLYRQTYELSDNHISSDAKSAVKNLSSSEILALRDQLIYFLMKLPGACGMCKDFVEYAVHHVGGDIMLSLCLAYSISAVMDHPHTLAFAKKHLRRVDGFPTL